MKKVFRLRDLDCANCAAKMEHGIAKIEGVREVSVNFIGQKIVLDADDERFDAIVDEMKKVCRRVEPDCVVLA